MDQTERQIEKLKTRNRNLRRDLDRIHEKVRGQKKDHEKMAHFREEVEDLKDQIRRCHIVGSKVVREREELRDCLRHILECGHLTPGGSTEGWAKCLLGDEQ